MTPVGKSYYEVVLDGGIRLIIELPDDINGPSIQPPLVDDGVPAIVRIPGKIYAVSVPPLSLNEYVRKWADFAIDLDVRIHVHPRNTASKKPTIRLMPGGMRQMALEEV